MKNTKSAKNTKNTKNTKNIFLKKQNLNNNSEPDELDLEIHSDDTDKLSDEFNKLVGNKKLKNSTKNVNQENQVIQTNQVNVASEFDITKVYNDIFACLSNYKLCKITGEIISFKITEPNAWLTIKTQSCQITGTFWKITSNKNYQNFRQIKPGDKIIFEGYFSIMKNLTIYFNIKSMEQDGKGKYLDLYEQYRLKIKELGLGIPKKVLNSFPLTIGIITSLEGAAIQDILQTFRLDKFIGNVIIKNAIVQGSQCPKSLTNAIEWFESNSNLNLNSNLNSNSNSNIDILMITRGGGGYEDLVGFSDWDLLVKISSIKFITLSAVGHQVDNQLIDDVADYKFATPSIGAKFIVEKQREYLNNYMVYKNYINGIVNKYSMQKEAFNIILQNYSKILDKYDMKKILTKVKKYSNALNNLIGKYTKNKNNFYSKLAELKPTICMQKEITSINDFVNEKNNKSTKAERGQKSQKIEIYFIDGRVVLTYKIVEYERY